MQRMLAALALLTLVCAASAQEMPTRERVTLWGGAGSELVLIPGVSAGVSFPVASMEKTNVALRASAAAYVLPVADAAGVIPVVNADLLFSSNRPNSHLYGGPSVGTVMGQAWLVGGVVGARFNFSDHFGWYNELRGRVGFAPGYGSETIGSLGLGLGLTYRF